MNVFELNVLASPIGGLIGGLYAAKGIAAPSTAVASGIGLGIGVGLYFAIIGLGLLALKVAGLDKKRDAKSLDRAGSIMWVVVFFPMLILPILSGLTAHWFVGLIYG